MGWVTLNLRRMEDTVLHNNIQLELLNISRRRQQVLRSKNYQSLLINNKKKAATDAIKVDKDAAYKNYSDFLKEIEAFKSEYEQSKSYTKTSNGSNYTCEVDKYGKAADVNGDKVISVDKSNADYKEFEYVELDTSGNVSKVVYNEDEYKEILNNMQDHKDELYTLYKQELEQYEEDKLTVNAQFDEELSTLEAETTEEENEIDLEQAQIETRLEAMNQELQVVKQSASQDIQSTTIKLA